MVYDLSPGPQKIDLCSTVPGPGRQGKKTKKYGSIGPNGKFGIDSLFLEIGVFYLSDNLTKIKTTKPIQLKWLYSECAEPTYSHLHGAFVT